MSKYKVNESENLPFSTVSFSYSCVVLLSTHQLVFVSAFEDRLQNVKKTAPPTAEKMVLLSDGGAAACEKDGYAIHKRIIAVKRIETARQADCRSSITAVLGMAFLMAAVKAVLLSASRL